ncbi:MAG: ABC transporter substrate-binding protein [Betaproteobacteria bacterium]
MRRFILCFVLVIALVSLGAVAYSAEPIVIGFNLEMTGQVAAYGQAAWEGVNLIKELVKPEVLGRPVVFKLLDNKSDKVEAANAASRLIENDKAVAIIGPTISGNMLAAGEICEKKQVPIIGPTTTNPLCTQGKKYVFRACFIDPFQASIAATYCYRDLKAKTAAILSDIANDYCIALGTMFEKEFTKLGGKVLTHQKCKYGDQDFSAQLTEIKNKNPDVIYIPNYYQETALAVRQARDLGLTQPVFGADGIATEEFLSIGGKAVEGVQHTTFWHEKAAVTDIGKKYVELYKKKFGADSEVNVFGALGADCYLIVLDAIKRAGSDDPKKIAQAIEDTKDLPVVTGPVTIENGDAIKPVVFRIVKNGKWEYQSIVYP